MHVRIGVTETPKELDIEMPDDTDAAALQAEIDSTLGTGAGTLWLTDKRGRQVGIPVARVGWVDIAAGDAESRIGFG